MVIFFKNPNEKELKTIPQTGPLWLAIGLPLF